MQMSILKIQRCFSLVLCIYIKKQSFVCFITLIIVIKSLPFLICGLGFCCLFSCLGVLFVFLGKKKKKPTLAFSVCTAAGQDIIEVF